MRYSVRSAITVMAAVLGLAMSGCGPSDPCSKADGAASHLAAQAKSCSSATTIEFTMTTAQCEGAIKSCSDDDKKSFEKAFDCMDGMSACVPGKESDFTKSGLACLAPLLTISSACQTALGQ